MVEEAGLGADEEEGIGVVCRITTCPVTREVSSSSSPFCSTNSIDFTVLGSVASTLPSLSPPSFPNRRIRTAPEIHSPTPTTTSLAPSHTASALISSAKPADPSETGFSAARSRSTSSRAKLPTARKPRDDAASCAGDANASKDCCEAPAYSPAGVTKATWPSHCATCSVRYGRNAPSGRNARSRRTNRCVLAP